MDASLERTGCVVEVEIAPLKDGFSAVGYNSDGDFVRNVWRRLTVLYSV